MATLAFSLAGQFVGGMVGGPIGATIGRALGALAGAAVDNAIFAPEREPTRAGADVRLQGSSEGGAIPRVYGWNRITGNIIWATELEEITTVSAGAKATAPATEEREVVASFALAICEGEVHRVGRVWADGQRLDLTGVAMRVYRGTQSQLPDSLIEAKQGVAPAYRGLCYLVFERLPLSAFGNRIPNLSVEVCRVVGDLEPSIRAVTVIPGATEFGYDPAPRVRVLGLGATANENSHFAQGQSDWSVSIDELQALCPNLKHVSLVVAWFGDDLRAGVCRIGPRVESADRQVNGVEWSVAGLTRSTAPVVSQFGGGPAYGGTPSDAAVLSAIADLKARGVGVTLYPMVLMDVPVGNALANPHGGASQPAYPWRGRITCHPAPGRVGSPDESATAASEVAAFVAGSGGYRAFVLHYAGLAVAAGGVDALLIGSEMRGLTTVRGAGNSFPFVAALVSLAAEVRGIVGAGTKLSYAADWSEYAGYQPADVPGEKFFHLDPLWASSAIDAVGIDNYMPVSDWRDDENHADAAVADSPYDPAYLDSHIGGGEGFDWYYASDGDRASGTRTPISDGAYGEPFVWRFKDIAAWWGTAHHDRPGGVRAGTPTAWVPESKPIWFTEIGCGAVDKGANQPNVFGDPKSTESARPYFSTGAPDALMQRQVLRAQLAHWADAANNPAASLYAGRMLDLERIYLWTWDARPYPAFPGETTVWADGPNHASGHWITGRLGAMTSGELIRAVAGDYDVPLGDAAAPPPLVYGMRIEGVVSCREALGDVIGASGLEWLDRPEGLALSRPSRRSAVSVAREKLVDGEGPLLSRRRPDPSEAVGRVALGFLDRERAYLAGTVTATRLSGGGTSGQNSGLVLDLAGARHTAERLLIAASSGRDTLETALPPSMLALEAGDVLAIEGEGDGPFHVIELRDGAERKLVAKTLAPTINAAIVADRPSALTNAPAPRALPVVVLAHLPALSGTDGATRLAAAGVSTPWPGDITIEEAASGASVARLTRAGAVGELIAALPAGPFAVWDRASVIDLRLYGGHLASADDGVVLGGGNRLALETDAGTWEIIGFAQATLVAPGHYRLTQLLRGLEATDANIGPASVGRRVLVLDERAVSRPVPAAWVGQELSLRIFAGSGDAVGTTQAVSFGLDAVRPLAPVHLRARKSGTDVVLNWTRRSRLDADNWALADAPLEQGPENYRVEILSGMTPVRVLEVGAPLATYSLAQQTADFGGAPSAFGFAVAKVSAVYGIGNKAMGTYHA